jgi:hypothetical protein
LVVKGQVGENTNLRHGQVHVQVKEN